VRVGQGNRFRDDFGDLIESLYVIAFTKLLAKMSAGAPGAESENQLFKSKTTFQPNLI
jgi:hypothetical protein